MAKKMTIEEASVFFGVSKEAIHNRVRRGRLRAIYENEQKYVLVEKQQPNKSHTHVKTPYEQKYHSYLEEHNKELQKKLQHYEEEIKHLREQKEAMLIAERKRIEEIYKEKDEQLKNILSAISSKFLLEAKPLEEKEEIEHLEAEIEELPPKPTALKKFLKQNGIAKQKRQKILNKVQKKYKKEQRFLFEKEKIYIFPKNYDYDDLL